MPNEFKPIVLITGAGTGIGAATARLFAARGAKVLLTGRRQALLEEVRGTLEGEGHRALPLDLGDSESIAAIVATLGNENLIPDVLVNNAGIFQPNDGAKSSPAIWRETFQTNLFGAAELTELLLPEMLPGSSVLNVSSGLGARPKAGLGVYSASKAALQAWTQALAAEIGARGIRVNAVLPGIVDTPIHDFNKLAGEEKSKALAGMAGLQPLGRIGDAESVAEALWFLASPASAWTTGSLLTVDGGINLV